MAKIIPSTEPCQHFLAERKESFWGDVYGETKLVWKQLLEADPSASAIAMPRTLTLVAIL
jgi:hypothetical protein